MKSARTFRAVVLCAALLLLAGTVSLHAQKEKTSAPRATFPGKLDLFLLDERAARILALERGDGEAESSKLTVLDTNLKNLWTLDPKKIEDRPIYQAAFGPQGTLYLLTMIRESSGEEGATSDRGFVIWKFDRAGKPLWSHRFEKAGDDIAAEFVVDRDDNVIVAYERDYLADVTERLVEKLSAAGKPLWKRTIEISSWSMVPDVGIDAAGRTHIVGARTRESRWPWFEHRAFAANGTSDLYNPHKIAGRFQSYLAEALFDDAGNVYVSMDLESSEGYLNRLVKLGGDGVTAWEIDFTGTGSVSNKLAHDGNGNLYVFGTAATDYDVQRSLRRIGTDGTVAWEIPSDAPTIANLAGCDDITLNVLRNNSVQIAGVTTEQIHIVRFDAVGDPGFTKSAPIPSTRPNAELTAVHAAASGTLYLLARVIDDRTYSESTEILKFVP